MRHAGLVLGTAGHIDHGKTALVAALTGVDTDRLPDEKRRGITIELGFAPLDLPDVGRVSVVDVPGHERLVRTMVSGASGMDLVLLVVAADEGVMPQTREHVAICSLLGIERGVVALTRTDLADAETIELAEAEVRDLLADTPLCDAPVVPVCAHDGSGLDALRDALSSVIAGTRAHTARRGPPRLCVDRTFAMRGFGTVATGTLLGGALELGDAVVVMPAGRSTRVRGLQCHGEEVKRAEPGTRCAVNLQGLEVGDLSRGDVVTLQDRTWPTRTLDARIDWLPDAPPARDPVAVELLCGTAERRARLAPIGGTLAPGTRGFARLHVDGDPLVALPGDRFIVRGFARTADGGATLGGGRVLDVAPPHRRRSDPALRDELQRLADGDAASGVRERVRRAGYAGVTAEALVCETGLSPDACRETLSRLEREGEAVRAGACWLEPDVLRRVEAQLAAALDAFHASAPMRPGMPRAALRGRLPGNLASAAAELGLARLEQAGEVVIEDDLVHRTGFAPLFEDGDRRAMQQIVEQARSAGLEPPSPRDWAERLGLGADRFRDLVAHLERQGELVRAPGDLWFARDAVDALCARVRDHLAHHAELDTRTYKGLIGTSRRTAMPLMELLDELHVTRRQGNARILRQGPAPDDDATPP